MAIANEIRKIQTQGVHHITLVGADRQTSIDFWEGVLGMPFVFDQPNLDNPDEGHLYFDPGDGRLITVFTNEERKPDPARTNTDPGAVHHPAEDVPPELVSAEGIVSGGAFQHPRDVLRERIETERAGEGRQQCKQHDERHAECGGGLFCESGKCADGCLSQGGTGGRPVDGGVEGGD